MSAGTGRNRAKASDKMAKCLLAWGERLCLVVRLLLAPVRVSVFAAVCRQNLEYWTLFVLVLCHGAARFDGSKARRGWMHRLSPSRSAPAQFYYFWAFSPDESQRAGPRIREEGREKLVFVHLNERDMQVIGDDSATAKAKTKEKTKERRPSRSYGEYVCSRRLRKKSSDGIQRFVVAAATHCAANGSERGCRCRGEGRQKEKLETEEKWHYDDGQVSRHRAEQMGNLGRVVETSCKTAGNGFQTGVLDDVGPLTSEK